MTERFLITDEIWEKIAPLLPAKPGDCGRKSDNRLFVEAVLFIARTGTPWRDMPKFFGHWNSIYKRFGRWERQGVWLRVFSRLAEGGDLSEVSIDGVATNIICPPQTKILWPWIHVQANGVTQSERRRALAYHDLTKTKEGHKMNHKQLDVGLSQGCGRSENEAVKAIGVEIGNHSLKVERRRHACRRFRNLPLIGPNRLPPIVGAVRAFYLKAASRLRRYAVRR